MKVLVAESEPAEARRERRASVGRSSGETFVDVVSSIVPSAVCHRITPADAGSDLPGGERLEGYDAVLLTGSPLHVYEDTPEVRREIDFMRAVFRSKTPAFGSCAGLQIAVMAAGGRVRAMGMRREAGFARRITATTEGGSHPMLLGRPTAWDAPAIHSDEVEELPPGATLLATNSVTRVQAAEIRFEGGLFWGVQYHPEITLREVAAALRRQAHDLIDNGLARGEGDVDRSAVLIDALHDDPGRSDLAWRLGLDTEVTDDTRRQRELRNFLSHIGRDGSAVPFP